MHQTHKEKGLQPRLIRREKVTQKMSGRVLMPQGHETHQMELSVDMVFVNNSGSIVGRPIMCLDIDCWSGAIIGFSLSRNQAI